MSALKKLLVAVDFAPPSVAALDWAIDLASQLGATVTVLHTVEMVIVGVPDGLVFPSPEDTAELMSRAERVLDATLAERRDRGVPLTGLVRQGVAWETIHEVAREIDADAIVVGTHGRKGLLHALLGSVAEKTIRTADRPVIVARRPV